MLVDLQQRMLIGVIVVYNVHMFTSKMLLEVTDIILHIFVHFFYLVIG